MIFKKGQKVVCITNHFSFGNEKGIPRNVPSKHEVVTVEGFSPIYPNCLLIQEYLYDTDGSPQCFINTLFRPLNYNNEAMIELLSMPITEEKSEIQKETIKILETIL